MVTELRHRESPSPIWRLLVVESRSRKKKLSKTNQRREKKRNRRRETNMCYYVELHRPGW